MVEKKMAQYKKELNTVISDVTYDFYASPKRQFKVEVMSDFLKKESVVDLILTYCWGKWKDEEGIEEEDVDPNHSSHFLQEERTEADAD